MIPLSKETRNHCQWMWREISDDIEKDVPVVGLGNGSQVLFNSVTLAAVSPLLRRCLDQHSDCFLVMPDFAAVTISQFQDLFFTMKAFHPSQELLQLLDLLEVNFEGHNPELTSEADSGDVDQGCKFGCTECQLTFDSFSDVKKHNEVNHNIQANIQCEDCKLEFNSLEGLTDHCKETHGDDDGDNQNDTNVLEFIVDENNILKQKNTYKKYMCGKCDKKFGTKAQLTHHMNIHLGIKPYICNICKKSFTQPTHLNVHMRVHDGSKPYMCSICGKTFAIASNMRKHQAIHERDKIESLSAMYSECYENEFQEEFVPMTNYKCNHCDNIFPTKKELLLHLTSHEEICPYSCSVPDCDSRFDTEKKLAIHARRKHGKKHICNFCTKVFISGSQLRKHVLIHTGDKPFNCKICDKSFTQKSHVTFHTNTVHNKDGSSFKKHACVDCGKTFSSKGVLTKHKMMHDNVRPHKCAICDKSFVQKSHLKVHLAKHTGDRPFLCLECGKSFTSKHHLKEHSQLHTGTKPWFQCSKCDNKYRGQTDLLTHMRTHTGETPYHCQEPNCGKSFRSFRSLENHLRIHTGSKPFSCHTCQKSFTTGKHTI